MQKIKLKNYFKDNQAMHELTARNTNAFTLTFASRSKQRSNQSLQKRVQANTLDSARTGANTTGEAIDD